MREVITLQFGEYSNYIGSHFWNIQQELLSPLFMDGASRPEIDHDVLHRVGIGRETEESYIPRALVFDLDGSAGLATARSNANRLYHLGRRYGETGATRYNSNSQTGEGSTLLSNAAQLYSATHQRRHEFQDYLYPGYTGASHSSAHDDALEPPDFRFSSTVKSWGDYLAAPYHTRSLIGIGGRTAYGDYAGSRDAREVSQGGSTFNAFAQGSALVHEDLFDSARLLLEESDGLQGFQAIVDIDSGFGSFGYEYLNFLREECPKAPILVFGAIEPVSTVSSGGAHHAAGGIDYHTRDRMTLRNSNIALGLAYFAGRTDLDALYVPLSLQSYLRDMELAAHALAPQHGIDVQSLLESYQHDLMEHKTVSSWFTGLSELAWNSKYQTSALLASAIDSITLPFRLQSIADTSAHRYSSASDDRVPSAPHYSGEAILPIAKMMQEDRQRMLGPTTGTTRTSTITDPRTRQDSNTQDGAHNTVNNNLYNAEVEAASSAPVSMLPSSLSMRDFLSFFKRTPSLNAATVALALPTALPYASASALDKILSSLPSIDQLPLRDLTPLSWTTKLPDQKYDVARDPDNADDRETAMRRAPFAHTVVIRGIGSHNLTSSKGYISSKRAYSQAMDNYLSKTYCHAAGHVVARTPLPIPMAFPSILPAYAYDEAGALVVDPRCATRITPPLFRESVQIQEAASAHMLRNVKGITASATISSASLNQSSSLPRTSRANPDGTVDYVMNISGNQQDGVVTSYSVPLMAHVSVSPEYGMELGHIHRLFTRRDRSIDFRNQTAEGQGLEMSEVADMLQDLCDAYSASD